MSESPEVQPERLGKRKADADGGNNNEDGADMRANLAKKGRTSIVMTKMQAAEKAPPPRKARTQSKMKRLSHNNKAGLGTHPDGPPQISITEQPDISGRNLTQLDSGYQYPDFDFEGACYERLHASGFQRNTEQVHYATTMEDPNVSDIQAFSVKNCGQTQVQKTTCHFSEECDVNHTFENLDFDIQNVEYNFQHRRNAGHSESDFESLDLFLQHQKRAHDSNMEI